MDFVTIEGAMYSGLLSFDLIVSNSFSVGFSAGSGKITKPGFVLFWECRNDVIDSKCCFDIKASGFSVTEINGIYTYTGNLINGRPLYVEQNRVYGIWTDGDRDWVIGLMSYLAEGNGDDGLAFNYKDKSCPLFNKKWDELVNNLWTFSQTAIVDCVV